MNPSDEFEEIRLIADDVCDGEVTPEQMQKLEALLTVSEEAKRFYLDYIGMHAHMKAASSPQVELVMRRSQVDEFIVRPAGSSSDIAIPSNNSSTNPTLISGPTASSRKNPLIWGLLTICGVLLIYIFMQSPKDSLGEVKQGRIKDLERHAYPENVLAGEYLAETDSFLKFNNSSSLKLTAGSSFDLTNANKIYLKKGSLQFIQESDNSLSLTAPNFKMISASKSISLMQDPNFSEIEVNSNNTFTPLRWRPKHYWNFDHSSDRALDSAGEAHGIISEPVKPVTGLLGKGAFHFNQQKDAIIKLGSGGGTALATGSFAVSDGLTIEALVKTEWSGKFMDSDEIFRKDKGDGNMRMLFCFQNDYNKKHVFPKDYHGPTLSFGLYLVGHDYHELKLPLDGKDGRPTLESLKDGKAHHVAATYNVRSGVKGIYIDGTLLMSHQYEPGTRMITGGPGSAVIGNTPTKLNEAFTGVIDEVAFYDFALPSYMVLHHFSNFQKGLNYYGLEPGSKTLPDKLSMKLPADEVIILDSLTGLPVSIKIIKPEASSN
jgi:hypothetical protein